VRPGGSDPIERGLDARSDGPRRVDAVIRIIHLWRRIPLVAGLALLAACATTRSATPQGEAAAPAPTYEWPRLSLSAAGEYFSRVDTTFRVDSDILGRGTELDLEDELDVDETAFAARVDAAWHFFKRHWIDVSYFDLKREGEKTIDRDIEIGNTTFPVNSDVDTEFETEVATISYRLALLWRERWHAGVSLGTYWFDMSAEFTAGGLGLEESVDASTPLPVYGIFGSWAWTPDLYLTGVSEFFSLDYEEYDGFFNDTRLLLEHRTFDHIALGIGLDYFGIDATVESENDDLLEAEFDYDYVGVLVFAKLY
jgi:hypothetical protein